MTIYKPGDLVLLDFPFTSGEQTKRRPALVLLDDGGADVVVARVTSQSRQDTFDVELTDWRGAGLILPSVARLHKIATLEKTLVVRTLGGLQSADRQAVATKLEKLFGGWKQS